MRKLFMFCLLAVLIFHTQICFSSEAEESGVKSVNSKEETILEPVVYASFADISGGVVAIYPEQSKTIDIMGENSAESVHIHFQSVEDDGRVVLEIVASDDSEPHFVNLGKGEVYNLSCGGKVIRIKCVYIPPTLKPPAS